MGKRRRRLTLPKQRRVGVARQRMKVPPLFVEKVLIDILVGEEVVSPNSAKIQFACAPARTALASISSASATSRRSISMSPDTSASWRYFSTLSRSRAIHFASSHSTPPSGGRKILLKISLGRSCAASILPLTKCHHRLRQSWNAISARNDSSRCRWLSGRCSGWLLYLAFAETLLALGRIDFAVRSRWLFDLL
jgi:hypothetical protein